MSTLLAYETVLADLEKARNTLRRIASIAMSHVSAAQHADNKSKEADWKMVAEIADKGWKE
jgi:hypothetical protein